MNKMSRIFHLQKQIDLLLCQIKDPGERCCAYMHLFGVSQCAALIAAKRGVDVGLATIAGLLHDIYEYKCYDCLEPLANRQDHGIRNAVLAGDILAGLKLTTEAENEIICGAIQKHGYKDRVDSPIDEVIKDADILQKQTQNDETPIHPIHVKRFTALSQEFGFIWHNNIRTRD